MADVPEQLSIVVEHHDRRVLLRLRGELDLVTAPAFGDAVGHVNSDVIVDLAELSFLDASGLGALDHAAQRAEQHGDQLVVINANPLAQRIFQVAGLERLLSGSEAP